jgi:hypothetical protein
LGHVLLLLIRACIRANQSSPNKITSAVIATGQIVATALSKATETRRAVLLTPISPVPST